MCFFVCVCVNTLKFPLKVLTSFLFHAGVRTFVPSAASNCFLYVGGPAVVLSLVAMAPDDSSLYAAVKVLHSVLETSSAMQQEMTRINGYKVCQIFVC